jgi:DNA (cytosine-5)-methyltransferase 1
MRPRLLDLFCCEGGAGMGYHRAGFDVVGVDKVGRFAKRYPFEFHQADAIEYVKAHGHEFDAVHSSPPCQAYSITKHSHNNTHPKLIEPTRAALLATGKPYVIENVVGAPLLDPLMLCGDLFGLTTEDTDGLPLRLERHRLFESNVFLVSPGRCWHASSVRVGGAYGGGSSDRTHGQGGPARRVHTRQGGPGRAARGRLDDPARDVTVRPTRLHGMDWRPTARAHRSRARRRMSQRLCSALYRRNSAVISAVKVVPSLLAWATAASHTSLGIRIDLRGVAP